MRCPLNAKTSWLAVARAALVFVVVSSVACTAARSNYNYAAEPDPRRQEFVIGPSDVLHVSVLHNPDVSVDAHVRPDGTITVPLIGDIKAADRTMSEVRGEIATKLQRFLKDDSSTLTLALTTINSYRVVISGNVEHPGVFASAHYLTVSEAIALAGGPNRFASPDQTILTRKSESGPPKRIPIDYPGILAGRCPEQDLVLLAGDQITVP